MLKFDNGKPEFRDGKWYVPYTISSPTGAVITGDIMSRDSMIPYSATQENDELILKFKKADYKN